MNEYRTEYKDCSNHVAVMISTDRSIFNEKSAVRARVIEYAKFYKELHIIVFSTQKFKQEQIAGNCTIYSTNSLSRYRCIRDACRIGRKIIRNFSRDEKILITCQDPFETGLVGKCIVNIRKNSELLLQIHTDLFSPYFTKHSLLNRIRLFISKFTLPSADTVRVVSKRIADSLLERGFKKEEIILKPIGVSINEIKNSNPSFDLHKKFPKFNKIIIMISRLESEKNIEMALYALAIALRQVPDLGLIIVGSGRSLGKLQKLAYNLKISQNTVFEGWQTDLVPYYKGADLLLVTSWYEGYGMIFKEAQVAGLKIVSTDVGIAREIGANIVGWKAEEIAEGIIKC